MNGIFQEISDLQTQIKAAQQRESKSSIELLQADIKQLESAILTRRMQIANLQMQLRDFNLSQFSHFGLQPPPEGML